MRCKLYIVWALCLFAHGVSHAQATCPNAQWTLTSSTPAYIYGTPAANTNLYSGALAFDSGVCTLKPTPTFGDWMRAVPGFVSKDYLADIALAVSGVNVRQNPPSATLVQSDSGKCTLTLLTPPGAPYEYALQNTSSTSSAQCRFTATYPFVFTKAAGTMSGTLPANQLIASPVNYNHGSKAWGFWFTTNAPIVEYNAQWTPTFVTVSCTVSTPNVTVPLPTVAKSVLSTAGATAGLTPFTLGLSGCSSGGGGTYAVQASWSFTPGPSSSVVANSAASPASNVYVQLLDSTPTPITNGASATLANVTAGGSFSATYYARYYATAAAGSGAVKGTATFTLAYQ